MYIKDNIKFIKQDLKCLDYYEQDCVDILMVVYNQLEYVKEAIESIEKHTKNYNLYIWDNNSNEETKEYLKTINAHIVTAEENLGFIKPNNRLFEISQKHSNSEFVILLNSDCVVKNMWEKFLVGYLKFNVKCGAVGYGGCNVDENGKGYGVHPASGKDIDFVPGFCLATRRSIVNSLEFLFDEFYYNFAYFEDSDFCLRLKEKRYELYSSCLDLVFHYENVTTKKVHKELNNSFMIDNFRNNQNCFIKRWSKYLDGKKILNE